MQLAGQKVAATAMASCEPLLYLNGDKDKIIDPCGLVAWSNFNDTYDVRGLALSQRLALHTACATIVCSIRCKCGCFCMC